MICAGERRHYLTVEVPKKIPNGRGGFEDTWTPRLRVWAKISPVSARERIESSKPAMDVSHNIIIPYVDGFKPEWRLTKRSRVFEVVSILNTGERDEDLQVLCKERVK